jgi:protein FrlC
MRISFNTWLYASFPAWLPSRSLHEVVDLLGDLGYDGLELGGAAPHGYPDYLDAQRRADLGSQVQRRGMEVSAICPALGGGPGYNPVSLEAAEREAGLDYMTKIIRLAADIGCEQVIWLGGYRRYGQDPRQAWAWAAESLAACADVARDAGVKLTVEPTAQDSNVIEDAKDCLRLLDDAQVGADVAGVMLDTAHIYHRNDDVRAAFREAGERLTYVHLADDNRDAPGDHRDFTSVIEELRSIGYDGWISAEVGFNRREVDPDALARRSIAHLRDVLGRVADAAS